jgi:hypothetical protein
LTQDFLIALQREISTSNHLVSKVANAHFSFNPANASSTSGFPQQQPATDTFPIEEEVVD